MREAPRRFATLWLGLACAAAAIPAAARLPEVAAEIARDRRAAAIFAAGSAEFVARRYDAAASAFRQVIALQPAVGEAYGALAEAEFRAGRVDDAVAAYRRLLAIYPYTYTASLYREVGALELRAGRAADARTDLQEAVGLDPSDWLAYHYLGHALWRLGDLAGARAAWERTTILNPAFAPAKEQLRRLDDH